MIVQMQGNNGVNHYNGIFTSQNKRSEEKGDRSTIDAVEMKARQAKNEQDCTKNLYKEMEQLQKSIQKVQEDQKLSSKTKAEMIEQIKKDIQAVQQQIAKVQQQEEEEKIKEEQEKQNQVDKKEAFKL